MTSGEIQITFYGPYNLKIDSGAFLYNEPQNSFTKGLYIIAWPHKGKYYPHYIGMTERPLIVRINEHLRNYLSGRYYLYNRSYLDAACREPASDPQNSYEKYIYKPLCEESFGREFIPRLKESLAAEIVSYIHSLAFFLAPLPDAEKEILLGIEAILTERAYAGKAKYIIDRDRKSVV